MKRFLPLFTVLALAAALTLTFFAHRVSADDAVASKMLALFPRFDAEHKNVLSPEEQAQAVDAVKKIYGEQWGRQIEQMFARAATADKTVTLDAWRKEVASFGQPPVVQT